jgi:GNAT superfamily N-acetyltransferase
VPNGRDSTARIRRAAIEDAPDLARLRWLWRTTERGECGLSEPEFETAFADWWSGHQSGHTAFIAEQAGHPVGMAWLAIFDRIPHPRRLERRAGNVQSVFVLEEHRNRGIGGALVEAVIAEAHARGLGYLIVHPSERAYPLYERVGFGETNRILHLDLDGREAAASRG